MKDKQYILFDLDGTLTDSKEGIINSALYALAKYGIEVDPSLDLTFMVGPPLMQTFTGYFRLSNADAKLVTDAYREHYITEGVHQNYLFPGVGKMLEELKTAGRTLLTATSKLDEQAEKVLLNFNIRPFFDFVGGSGNGERDTKAKVIAHALSCVGSPAPGTVIMVGDRVYDVAGAKEQGLECIGVRYGYAPTGELEEAGVDYIVDTVEDLTAFLLK